MAPAELGILLQKRNLEKALQSVFSEEPFCQLASTQDRLCREGAEVDIAQ